MNRSGYTTREVADLLDLPIQRIRSYARAGFVRPARGAHNEYLFSFQDLVLLRTAADLARQRVPARRISQALQRLQTQLPTGRPLSGLTIQTSGGEIVARESGEPPWNPGSGQYLIEFQTSGFAAPVASLTAGALDRPLPAAPDRTASDWLDLGLELEHAEPAEARRAYENALRLDPELDEARVNLGRLLHEAGRLEEAASHYRRVLDQREHAVAAYNLGVVLEDLGQAADAIHAYARAIAADPRLAEAHFNLARLYEQRGDRRNAIRHFNGYRALLKR